MKNIIFIVALSLMLLPVLQGCGVKGNLELPAEAQTEAK